MARLIDQDNLMQPIITLCGTSRESLVRQRIEAREAVYQAMRSLGETAPNGRDYIGNNEAFARDREIYQARFAVLDKLHNELLDEAAAIQGEN